MVSTIWSSPIATIQKGSCPIAPYSNAPTGLYGASAPVAQAARVSRVRGRSRFMAGALDRKSVVQGKSVSVRVDVGGRSILKIKFKKEPVSINHVSATTT